MQQADTILRQGRIATRSNRLRSPTSGLLHQSLGDYQGAIPFFQRALEISSRLHDDFWTAKWLNNLAEVYISLGDLSTAERYNNQALAMQKARNDPEALIYPILNAARIAAGRGKTCSGEQVLPRRAGTQNEGSCLALAASMPALRTWRFAPAMSHAHASEVEKAVSIIDASWSQLSNDQSKLTFPAA